MEEFMTDRLTRTAGSPIADNRNSIAAGPRETGPLLED
jgi:catalase